jgi:hypothetical protein
MAKSHNLQVKNIVHPKKGLHKKTVSPLPSDGRKVFPRQNQGKKVGD